MLPLFLLLFCIEALALLAFPAVDDLLGDMGVVVKPGLLLTSALTCSSDRGGFAAGSFLLFLAGALLVLGLAEELASGTSLPRAVDAAARSVAQPPSVGPFTLSSRRASIKSPTPLPPPPPSPLPSSLLC